MNLYDYFFIAFSYMKHRRLRTWLTMLGIFIGIAAVVSLVSLGKGMQDAINSQFASFGTDKIIITSKSPGFVPPGTLSTGKVTEDDVKLLRRVPGVKFAAGRILESVSVDFGDEQKSFFAISVPNDEEGFNLIKEVGKLSAKDGRILKGSDKKKVMIGYDIAYKNAFAKKIRPGNKLKMKGDTFEVIGIAEKIGDPDRDNAIYMMENEMRKFFNKKDEYSLLLAQIDETEDPDLVAQRIKQTMRRDRNQKIGKEDFKIMTSKEILNQLNTILQLVTGVLIGIAAISLVVGGIGIMNTMYTAVLERTRDIGIMKAIGAQNKDIMSIFLVESGLLGLVGGLVGIMLGVGIAKSFEMIATFAWGQNLLQAATPWYLFVFAILFAFLVGAFSGLFPARQASHLKPSEALKYE